MLGIEGSIFFGGSVIAATVAGVIALFSPCCISIMLPAFFASSFQNRPVLIAMTFLFAAGVTTVILPLVLGASILRRLFIEQHTLIYALAGLVMLAMAVYTLLGGKLQSPMPGRSAAGKAGPLGVYSLGIFSGVASSCCAPVLAGVIALSSVASSFGLALGLGVAYVFGMVAPLFVISLLWERYDWRSSRLFRPRSITWRIGGVQRTLSFSALASGSLLLLMAVATIWAGLASDAMPGSGEQAARISVWLQHYGQWITDALSTVPNWLIAIAGAAVLWFLIRRALRQVSGGDHWESSPLSQQSVRSQGEPRETCQETFRPRA